MRTAHTILVVMLLVGWTGSGRAADLVVIASGDASIRVGAIVDGSKTVNVAAGATIVLVSADGRTIRLSGPYSGAPDPSPPATDGRLVDSLSRLITEEPGSVETLAVFRGGFEKPPIGRPDIWGVDIARAGTYCVRPDRPVMLWWGAARAGAVVKLAGSGDGSASARIRWPQSKKYTAWPNEITLADGASYVARFRSGDAGTRLTTLLMPELDTDAHHAAWMAEHGCTRQALGVLDAMGEGEL